jgi:hypothetical protein
MKKVKRVWKTFWKCGLLADFIKILTNLYQDFIAHQYS